MCLTFLLQVVEFTIIYYDIEHCGSTCNCDGITVTDGGFQDIVNYPRLCGTNYHPTIFISSNELNVNFYSDSSITSEGFEATFVSISLLGMYTSIRMFICEL